MTGSNAHYSHTKQGYDNGGASTRCAARQMFATYGDDCLRYNTHVCVCSSKDLVSIQKSIGNSSGRASFASMNTNSTSRSGRNPTQCRPPAHKSPTKNYHETRTESQNVYNDSYYQMGMLTHTPTTCARCSHRKHETKKIHHQHHHKQSHTSCYILLRSAINWLISKRAINFNKTSYSPSHTYFTQDASNSDWNWPKLINFLDCILQAQCGDSIRFRRKSRLTATAAASPALCFATLVA